MGIYSDYNAIDEDFGIDMEELVEAFLIDDLMHNYGDETIREFCAEGGVGEALLEIGVLKNKNTVIRMNKESDLKRRTVVAAIMMAKAKNDPMYSKLVKYKALYKQSRNKIVAKYSSKASKAAIKGQKEYMKAMRGVQLSNNLNAVSPLHDKNR